MPIVPSDSPGSTAHTLLRLSISLTNPPSSPDSAPHRSPPSPQVPPPTPLNNAPIDSHDGLTPHNSTAPPHTPPPPPQHCAPPALQLIHECICAADIPPASHST